MGKKMEIATALIVRTQEEIIKKYEIPDAFLVAFFKDEMISMQEAMELLR